MWVRSLNWEEEEVASNSSVLPGKIPWTEEPGGLQSVGSQRAGPDWAYKQCQGHLGIRERPDAVLQGDTRGHHTPKETSSSANQAEITLLLNPKSKAHQGHMYFASLESDYNYNIIIFNIKHFPCQSNFPSKLFWVEYDLDIILLRPTYSVRLTHFSTFKTWVL